MPRIIISEPGKKNQPYRLKISQIVVRIGRGSNNDIIISNSSASTNHCKINRIEGGFIIRDNHSTNGIKHEGKPYSIIDLKDGMTVQIGDDIDMKFSLSEEEKEILSLEDFEPQQKLSSSKNTNTEKETSKTKTGEKNSDKNENETILEEAPLKYAKKKSIAEVEESPEKVIKNTPLSYEKSTLKKVTNGLGFIMFIILAILFFAGGLAVRHYQDHNTFIFLR